MTDDIEKAKIVLHSGGHTIVLCQDGDFLMSQKRGIAPMLEFIKSGIDLSGYSAADKIVGKAAAMLFVLAGIKTVYAEVLSESGAKTLRSHGVSYSYGTLCAGITNRAGTGICPMESAVENTESPEDAYEALLKKSDELRGGVKK